MKNQWGLMVDETQPHLGGYQEGGDPGCLELELWRWLVETRNVATVLDVGCGDGAGVRFLRSLGVDAIGIDGVPQEDEHIALHDYTTGPAPISDDFDLVWSCEFVEHVEQRHMTNFLSSFDRGKMLLITHAIPGQGGHHHVNCQESEYWIEAIEAGTRLRYDPDLAAQARDHALTHGYFSRTGLAFSRC